MAKATGVAWKGAVGVLPMLLASPFRDPFKFGDTNNATKARMDKPNTMELGRKRASSSFKKQRSPHGCALMREADARLKMDAQTPG